MSRCIYTWFALLILGLCTVSAQAEKHYISRTSVGQYFAFDNETKQWIPIDSPKKYVERIRRERPEGFGGQVEYKDWVKDSSPVAATAYAAAASVNTAANIAVRVPVVRRVAIPARGIMQRVFNRPSKQ